MAKVYKKIPVTIDHIYCNFLEGPLSEVIERLKKYESLAKEKGLKDVVFIDKSFLEDYKVEVVGYRYC